MKGQNTCQWLVIGSTELCGKSCLGDHCKIYLARLRRDSGTEPCMECGKGVENRFRICSYHKARMRAWQRDHKVFMVEFKRLAAIEIFIYRFVSVSYYHLELWYHKSQIRAWQRGHRDFMVEFKRLAAIEIFI